MHRRNDADFGTCMLPIREIVAKNLTALIEREKRLKGRLRTFQAIEDATTELGHTVGRSTVDRMSKGTTDFEVGNLEAIAQAFEVEVWQITTPNFDPSNPPVLRSVGEREEALYRNLEALRAQLEGVLKVK